MLFALSGVVENLLGEGRGFSLSLNILKFDHGLSSPGLWIGSSKELSGGNPRRQMELPSS